MKPSQLRQVLIESRDEAIQRLLADRAVARHPGIATAAAPMRVVAIGKGAPNMLRDCAAIAGDRIDRSLVITTDSTDAADLPAHAVVLRASHPIPDERSLDAATQALAFAASVPEHGTLVVLVSGGASSLVCAPPDGMSFETKRALVDELLRSGSSIHEVNTVRRHLSRIKGGGLAAASAAPVLCAIASDVINGQPHDVGSGPACVDPSSRQDAAAVLRRVLGEVRTLRLLPLLTHGLALADEAASRVDARIVVGPDHLARAVADALSRRGFRARSEVHSTCTADQLATDLLQRVSQLGAGEACVLASEPTLVLPASAGRGGRAGWVALRVLQMRALPVDAAVLCAASDGVDGNSGAAGACIASDIACDGSEAHRALASFDDASVHAAMGTHIPGGATGLNLTDVYVCARSSG